MSFHRLASSRCFSTSTKVPLNWLDLRGSGLSIVERLVLEECLLRHDSENWLVVGHHEAQTPRYIRYDTPSYCQNSVNPSSAIIMGIGGKPRQLLHTDRVKEEGCLTVKRFSGGGTVVIDADCLWTTLIMHNVPHVEPFPRPIMQWSAQNLFAPLFEQLKYGQQQKQMSSPGKATLILDTKSCGVENTGRVVTTEARVVRRSSFEASETTPDFALRENDYVLGHRKMGGNAQAIVKNGWLHHTSFLWDYNLENMSYLTLPVKRPEYRADRAHDEFLVKLSEVYPNLTKTDFYTTLRNVSEQHFALERKLLKDALIIIDKQGGLQHWFDNKSRTKILLELP